VTDPCTAPPALTSGATIRDLLDDEHTWTAVVTACVASGIADGDVDVARRLRPHLDAPLDRLVDALTAGGFVAGADALSAQLAQVLPADATGP
jgi:hypothetical protein